MPEGPEVQTIVSGLHQRLINTRLIDVVFIDNGKSMVEDMSMEDFQNTVISQTISGVHRHGKYIDIALRSGVHIVTHLKMTGQLIYNDTPTEDSRPRFLRCIFQFDNGAELCLADRSTWVKFTLLDDNQIATYTKFQALGIDIFSEDFTLDNFMSLFTSRRAVHSFLLDQKICSGLGNIYVNEVLFYSGIHPKKPANSLSVAERTALYYAIRHVTAQALKQKGTTFSDYRTPDGSKGQYQNFLKVYKRLNECCLRCGDSIQRIKVGGRSAFFCSKCQPMDSHDSTLTPQQMTFTQEWNAINGSSNNYVFVLIGAPSVGKTTLSRRLATDVPFVRLVPTIKTRPQRTTDIDGVDAVFLSVDEFDQMKLKYDFILYQEIDGHRYATPRQWLDETLQSGKDVLIILSAEGAQTLKTMYSNVNIIELIPPSEAILKARIQSRTDYHEYERRARIHNNVLSQSMILSGDFQIIAENSTQTLQDAIDIIYQVRCHTD